MPTTYVIRHERSHAPADVRLIGRWSELEPALTCFRAEARALTYGRLLLVNEVTRQTLETIHAGQERTRFA